MKTILLHGLGQTSSSWKNTINTMGKSADILCPNLFDWFEDKEVCYQVLYLAFSEYCKQFSEPVNICGLSLGGILALQYGIENPDKINSLALVATQYTMPKKLLQFQNMLFRFMPKRTFESMGLGRLVGIMFFLLVLCAAVTSSIALTESAVSTFQDELKWCRQKSTLVVGAIMIVLGSLSSLGYGPLACVKIIGMQFLDFFDFLTNSVMMPIAAIATCLLISRVIGLKKIEDEVVLGEGTFKRKKIFNFMIKYLCPIFAAIILLSSVANAFGWISM